MTDSLALARADLAAGRAWKARDRLTGLLTHRQDAEVLDLLATVHHEMKNLPAAGALWFVTGRDDAPARAAIAAWHERFGNDEVRWQSIPAPVRHDVQSADLEALHRSARRHERSGRRRPGGGGGSGSVEEAWWEPVLFGGGFVLFVVWLVAMIGIGMWTVAHWIWG